MCFLGVWSAAAKYGPPHWLRPIYLIDVKRWRCWCEEIHSTVPTTSAICIFTLHIGLGTGPANSAELLKPERQRFFSSLLTEVNTLLDGGIGKPLS